MSSPAEPKFIPDSKKVSGGCRQRLQRTAAGRLPVLSGDCQGSLLLETVIAVMVFALVGWRCWRA